MAGISANGQLRLPCADINVATATPEIATPVTTSTSGRKHTTHQLQFKSISSPLHSLSADRSLVLLKRHVSRA